MTLGMCEVSQSNAGKTPTSIITTTQNKYNIISSVAQCSSECYVQCHEKNSQQHASMTQNPTDQCTWCAMNEVRARRFIFYNMYYSYSHYMQYVQVYMYITYKHMCKYIVFANKSLITPVHFNVSLFKSVNERYTCSYTWQWKCAYAKSQAFMSCVIKYICSTVIVVEKPLLLLL